MSPKRPMLRYHGGKWRIADWILAHFPPHRAYVEPFGGAASMLLRKPRSACETLNELDDRIVRLYQVLRDPKLAADLKRRLELTPFGRAEFNAAYTDPVDLVDDARKTLVLSFMGQGSDGVTRGYRTGFRCRPSSERQTAAHEWAGWPAEVPRFVSRLSGVLIESTDALRLIPRLDSPDTLTYCDPPYVLSTRSAARGRHGYRYEMTDAQHVALAEVLHACKGMVALSGYRSGLYAQLYADWPAVTLDTRGDNNLKRTEVLWLNPACRDAQRQGRLIA